MFRALPTTLALLAGLAACTQVPPINPETARGALYEDFPETLFIAAQTVCSGPRDRAIRVSDASFLCESLPPPQAAAALILEFDGTVESIPVFITRFDAIERAGQYLVLTDNYVRIAQRSGEVIQVRVPDPELERQIDAVFRATGGEPL